MTMERDKDFLITLLEEYKNNKTLYLHIPISTAPSEKDLKRHHHAELLCDVGHFERVEEGKYRMTHKGYDYLEAINTDGYGL